MNYAMPTYECQKKETTDRIPHYSCTVEIGGIRYIGAVAKTKREAEIKAARTALLAIQSSSSEMGENPNEETHYTVLPCKRKEPETVTAENVALKTREPKKGRFRKKPLKKRRHVSKGNSIQSGNLGVMSTNLGHQAIILPSENSSCNVTDATRMQYGIPNMSQSYEETAAPEDLVIQNIQISDSQPISMNATKTIQDGITNMNQSHEQISALQVVFTTSGNVFSNSQVSECQSVSGVANLNVNQRHGDSSASEVLVPSVGPNFNSIQKNDAVGCIVQPPGLGQSNVSNSKKCEGGGCPGDSAVSAVYQNDSSTLISVVGSPGDLNEA